MGFLNIIIEKISFENKSYIYFLFLFNLGIQILLGTTLPLSLSADSYHYLQIANAFDITNFISKDSLGNRSIGYPFFLYILGSKTIIGTTIIIFVQSLMAILTPVLIFIFLSNNPWKNQLNIAKIVAFFLSIFPYIHYMSSQIMAETLYVFLLVLSLFYFENFIKKKNVESFFYLIFIFLLAALVRPSGIMLLYLLSIVILVMLLTKTINYIKFILITILYLLSFSIFEAQNTEPAKNFLKFIAFSQHSAVGFCKIKDENKIKKIKDSNWVFVPDKANYLVIKQDKSNVPNDRLDYIFKEKCMNLDNPGKRIQKYIDVLIEMLNDKDEPLRTILTSTYDKKGSPDKIDPEYNNLTPIEIIKKIHREYIFPLPFQHIWWRMSAYIGSEETNKIISGVILETSIKRPETWGERVNFLLKNMSPLNILKTSGLNQSGIDMIYWRFIPSPYKEIKNQNANHVLVINKKLYLQNIYSLEKIIGKSINKIYKKNIPVWSEAEKDYFQSYRNLFFEDFNIGQFTAKLLWTFNYMIFNITKIIIIILIPLMSIYYFASKLTKRKSINESDYLAIFFTIFAYIGIVVSIFFFWDPRHVMMHFILFLPATCILLSKDKIK